MKEYQEKQKIRKIIYSNWSFAALFVILTALAFSTGKVYIKSRNAVLKNKEIRENLAALEGKQFELGSEIKQLQSESGAEKEIRKKFNMSKPGEKILMIIDKGEESDKIEQKKSDRFFSKIWRTIKRASATAD